MHNIETKTLSLGHFGYIPSHKKLVSHFELTLRDMRKAVDCIILGPKCKVSITEMKHYLVSLGIPDIRHRLAKLFLSVCGEIRF